MVTTPTTADHAGNNSARQSIGLPGHCEDCARLGHVVAHPDLGCGDVGCTREHHPEPATDSLTTRLLAEIERREAELERDCTVNDLFHHPEDLIDRRAYLAAFRKIVERHRLYAPPQYRGVPCCARCSGNGARPAMDYPGEGFNWPCPTIAAITEALQVAP